MSIDLCLVVSTLVSFSIFLLAKVVFFQIQAKDKLVYQIYRIFIKSWAFGLVSGYFFLNYLLDQFSILSGQVLLLITIAYMAISTLLTAVYIFGIFLMVYASLHLEILYKVAGFGQKGAAISKIFGLYNKNFIVTRRLQRLVESGELTFSGGKYRLTKSRSPLLIREKISIIITKLFPSQYQENHGPVRG